MSSVVANIVIGLVTSLLSGTGVWLGQRLLRLRRRRRAAAFYGVGAGDRCLLVIYRMPWQGQPDSMRHPDILALVDLAVQLRELGAEPEVVPFDALTEAPGQQAEFCLGGPSVNPRTRAHLAHYLPGVTVQPYDPERRDSIEVVAGQQRFARQREPDEQVYAVLARFVPSPGSRPVFVVSGQTAVANRGAVAFLTRNDRRLQRLAGATGRFCLVVRVASPQVYGHGMVEVAGDITEAAFAPEPAAPPGAELPAEAANDGPG